MARKLNKNLVGALTLGGMLVLAVLGIVLIKSLPSQDPKRYEQEAKKYRAAGEYNPAAQAYLRAFTKSGSSNLGYLVEGARCAIDDGDLRGAGWFLQQALLRESTLAPALELMTQLQFELGNMSGSGPNAKLQWQQVLEVAKKLYAVDANSVLANHALGMAYLNLQDDDPTYAAEGGSKIHRALELDPTNVDIVEDVVQQASRSAAQSEAKGQTTEAEGLRAAAQATLTSALEKATSEGTSDKVHKLKLLQAGFLLDARKDDESLALLKQLAAEEQTEAGAHLLLARIYGGGIPGKVPGAPARVPADPAKAIELAEQGLKLDPKNSELYAVLAERYRLADKGDEAAAVYERALTAIPRQEGFRAFKDNRFRIEFITQLFMLDLNRAEQASQPSDKAKKEEALAAAEGWAAQLKHEVAEDSLQARFVAAELLKVRGDLVGAVREAETANQMVDANRHFLLQALLSELYMRQQQWGAARKSLEAALTVQPGAPILWIWLGTVYLESGEPAKALEILKPAQAGALRDFLVSNDAAIRLRIRANEQLRQFAEADKERQALPESMRQDPLAGAGRLLAEGKTQEAEQALKAALEKDPENLTALSALVQHYIASKRTDEAKALLAPRLAKAPENPVLRQLEWMMIAPDPSKEKEALAILESEKDDFVRAVRLADFYRWRKKPAEEAKELDEAERLRPQEPAVVERQFTAALLAKDWSRAEKYVTKSAELNLDGTGGKIPNGRLALAKADALRAEGKTSQAQEEANRAIGLLRSGLQQYPSNSTGWAILAEAQFKNNHLEDAGATLDQALELDPTNGAALKLKAAIAISQQNEHDEEKYLKLAAKYLLNDPWIIERNLALKEKQNPKEGIARRETLRKEDPKNIENLVPLARLYGSPKVADYDRATGVYREAVALAQDDLELLREFALFLGREDVNRPAQGEELLKKAIAEQSEPAKKALLLTYLGQFYEVQKAPATGDRYFRQAVSVDPSVRILVAAAEFSGRINRLNDALEYYDRTLKLLDKDQAAAKGTRERIIGLLLAKTDLEAAKQKIDDYTRQYPDDPKGLVFEGAWHLRGGDIQKAKEKFDSFLAKHPDNALVLWQRGQLYMLMGRWELAIADLKNAAIYSPDGFGYQHIIAEADCLVEAGRDGEAVNLLKDLLEKHPDERVIAGALADTYLQAHPPRFTEAEALIVRLTHQFPNETRWPTMLGRLGAQAGDWKKAIEGYEAAAEVARYREGTVPPLLSAYRSAGRVKDLIRVAEDKVPGQLLDGLPEALVHLAWAYQQVANAQKCSETFDRALASAVDFQTQNLVVTEMNGVFGKEAVLARCKSRVEADPENMANLEIFAHLQFMNGQSEEALKTCERIQALAVTDPPKLFAIVAQGMLLDQLGRYPEAQAKYEEALKIDPQQPTALNNLAYLLAEQMDKPAEALPYARQAYRMNSNDAGVLDTLGWILAKNKQWGEAQGMLLRAIEIDRHNVAALYHLGLVYKERKQPDEALQRLKEAEQWGEKDRLLPKIKDALKEMQRETGG